MSLRPLMLAGALIASGCVAAPADQDSDPAATTATTTLELPGEACERDPNLVTEGLLAYSNWYFEASGIQEVRQEIEVQPELGPDIFVQSYNTAMLHDRDEVLYYGMQKLRDGSSRIIMSLFGTIDGSRLHMGEGTYGISSAPNDPENPYISIRNDEFDISGGEYVLTSRIIDDEHGERIGYFLQMQKERIVILAVSDSLASQI